LPGGEGQEDAPAKWAADRTTKMVNVLEQHLRARAAELRNATITA